MPIMLLAFGVSNVTYINTHTHKRPLRNIKQNKLKATQERNEKEAKS